MKRRVYDVKKQTSNPFLNLYELDMLSENGKHKPYYLASRIKDQEKLKLVTKENPSDGVIIYSLYGPDLDQVVLIRQYRCTIDDYIYEFPAGLVEKDETFQIAGIRELKEETGLDFTPVDVDGAFCRPYFTSIGMTDESCAMIYGTAQGKVSKRGQEETEDIEIVLADRKEIRRILREENVSLMCAYMMMHFLATEPGHAFDFLKTDLDE